MGILKMFAPRAAWWLAAVSLPIAALAAMLAWNQHSGLSFARSLLSRSQLQANILILEAAVAVIAAPLTGVALTTSRRAATSRGFAHDGVLQTAWDVARPLIAAVTVFAGASAVMTMIIADRMPGSGTLIAASHATLWTATLSLAALGAWFGTAFENQLDAVGAAIGVAVLVTGSIFVAGPVVAEIPTRAINVVLLINPVVATAAAAHIDIFRMETLYRLSPLAHLQFDYPHWTAAVACFVIFTLLSFFLAGTRAPNDAMRLYRDERNAL